MWMSLDSVMQTAEHTVLTATLSIVLVRLILPDVWKHLRHGYKEQNGKS